MTAPTSAASTGGRDARSARTVWAAIAAALVLVAIVGGPPRNEGPPLDPEGVGPLGTRALVLLLEEVGADVSVTRQAPTADDDVALVLADALDADQRDAVEAWVVSGGTLVVADPGSPLSPSPVAGPAAAFGQIESTLERRCEVPALRGVDRIDPSGGVLLDASGGIGCFRRGEDAFVTIRAAGAGTVVSIGGAGALTNAVLGEHDNAALAVALLAPSSGTKVAFVRPPVPGEGDADLFDLIPPNVRQAALQLAIAFLLYALWRARRLGRPVRESQPVELPGSELVVAVGNLLQQARRRDAAGALLRDHVRRSLGEGLGLGPRATVAEVADVAAARTGIPESRVRDVLGDRPVTSDDDLVSLAHDAEALRNEVLHAR